MASIIIDIDNPDEQDFEAFLKILNHPRGEHFEGTIQPENVKITSSDGPAAFRSDAEEALRSWWDGADIPTPVEIVRGGEIEHTYARGMLDLLMSTFSYPNPDGDWDITRGDVWTTLFPNEMPKTFDEVAQAQGWNADSQNKILRDYIAGPKMVTLDEYARSVADVENGAA